MARTGTVLQLAHGVVLAGAVHLLVLALDVVVGMASGAVGSVAAVGPRCGLGIALMAADTADARVVVAGVVARGVAIGTGRKPAGGTVAFVTLDGGNKVTRRR